MADSPRKVFKDTWKGLHHRCLLRKKPWKGKIKTSQENFFFCNADANPDFYADADAEIPMPWFPNGPWVIDIKVFFYGLILL